MTNREVPDSIAGALTAVLRDCAMNYPDDHLEWARDSKRVHQNVRTRGLGFVTLDLPSLGDWLLASLQEGRLLDGSVVPLRHRRSKKDCRPRIFWGLWSRLFDERGLLMEDTDPTALFLLLTLTNMWKKVEVPCKDTSVRKVYEEYDQIERVLPPSHELWVGVEFTREDCGSLDDLRHQNELFPSGDTSFLYRDCQRICDLIVSQLGFFDNEEVVGRHGPGAVADLRRRDDKFIFPTWPTRLDSTFPLDQHAVLHGNAELEDPEGRPFLVDAEVSSYLTDVPKTQKGPRLIAEEPTCHQWIQQGISDLLRERVGRTPLKASIDFFDQQPSQDACRVASATGEAATIDLSSASDRLSTWLVQRVFRSNHTLLDMLVKSRTRFLVQDQYTDLPNLLRLRKFASMGSALTFPVQSIVFALLAIGVGSHLNPAAKLEDLARQVRVFGDDIVVPCTWVDCLTRLLTECGLKVNASKSFSRGKFRESCGLYAYEGYDVTPFRIRHILSRANGASHVSWAQSAYNAFIKGLWHTSEYLEATVTGGRKLPIVPVSAPPLGMPTYSKGLPPNAKLRWNEDLQKWFVDLVGFRLKSKGQRTVDGVNALLRLSRANYKIRNTLKDFVNIPAALGPQFVHELLEVVDGPAFIKRARVPVELVY